MRVKLAAGAILLAVTTASQAEWEYQEQKSAFQKPTPMAIGFSENTMYALGVQCDEYGTLLAFYMTNEPYEGGINDAKLLFRLGDGEIQRRTTLAEVAMGVLRFRANLGYIFAAQIAEGKSELSVAVDVGGRIIHEGRFSAEGARDAIGRLGDACGIPLR